MSRITAQPMAVNVTEWTQQDCTDPETMTWASLASSSGHVSCGPLNRHHLMSCSTPGYKQLLMVLSRYHKQTIHLTRSYKWMGNERRKDGKGKKRNDHWALALREEVLTLPSHLSTVKWGGYFCHISSPVKGQLSWQQQSPHEERMKIELGWPLHWPCYLLFYG